MSFTLTSTAFSEGGPIPNQYTCDGANRPIPLAWSGVPTGTAELALVMDDPDARGYVHWVVVAIPPGATSIGGDAPLPAGAREGRRSGGVGYTGPCPPSGIHHYVFNLYALSSPLALSGQPSADEVRQAAAGSTIATATLTGTYRRGG
jgi:Raf kinase inhibitor-like YbhB/YbcL family protein